MDRLRRFIRISNIYYNMGLDKARNRNLSGAVVCLKKSLQFNKCNIDARNLLGLIYYEIGEITDALSAWVISQNLVPENNRASIYLEKIRKKSGRLANYEEHIDKYNQALSHAKTGNEDLAILQLSRVVEENDKYLQAALLLSLLYIFKEEYPKAGRILLKILKVDKYNEKALYYLDIVRTNTGKADAEYKKAGISLSHKKMQDDDVILPSDYNQYTGWQTVFNIGIGLLIGASATLFLYMPTRMAAVNNAHNTEILSYTEKAYNDNVKIASLEEQITALQTENTSLSTLYDSGEENMATRLRQYQLLIALVNAYRKGDMNTASLYYADIDLSQITTIEDGSGIDLGALYADIVEYMTANAYINLASMGDDSMGAGDYNKAVEYFDKSLKLNSSFVYALLRKGVAYKALGETDKANEIFTEIITSYSGTDEAIKAKEERGY